MHYWCDVIRRAFFFSFSFSNNDLLYINRGVKHCCSRLFFSKSGLSLISFPAFPIYFSSSHVLSVRLYSCHHSISSSAGTRGFKILSPLESHPLCPTMSVLWPSNSWPTHGQFRFHSFHFLLQKTLFNCTTVEGGKRCLQVIKYFVFETASLYLMSWKILKPTALFSYCTWKSRLHAR